MRAVSGSARAGAVLWILGLQIFVAEYLVQRVSRPAYSLVHNYVSELGVVGCTAEMCSPRHNWLNASFVLQGLLILCGVFLLRRAWPLNPETSVALAFLSVCGAGIIIAGLMPGDVHHTRHVAAGAIFFACGSMAMLMFGVEMMLTPARTHIAAWGSLICGLIVGTATFLLEWRQDGGFAFVVQNVGIVERVPAYGIPLWLAAMGFGVLLRPREVAVRVGTEIPQVKAA